MKKMLLVLIMSAVVTGCWETEKGEKIGTLVKIGKQGFLFKTNEVELIRGGMNDGSGSFGASFHFTIEDKGLVNIAYAALENQKKVRIKYHKEFFTLFRTETGDNSFLDSIEFIN